MAPRPPSFPDERPTRPTSAKLRAVAEVSAAPKTTDELLGELMAATVQHSAVIEALSVQVGSLEGKWAAHAETVEAQKKEIKEATVKAATHGSNRLALLLGALVTLYEIAAPVLHDLAKWVHQ